MSEAANLASYPRIMTADEKLAYLRRKGYDVSTRSLRTHMADGSSLLGGRLVIVTTTAFEQDASTHVGNSLDEALENAMLAHWDIGVNR